MQELNGKVWLNLLDNDQLEHSFLVYLFYTSTCFEQQVLIIRRSKLY
jgi:hypothetical protein